MEVLMDWQISPPYAKMQTLQGFCVSHIFGRECQKFKKPSARPLLRKAWLVISIPLIQKLLFYSVNIRKIYTQTGKERL